MAYPNGLTDWPTMTRSQRPNWRQRKEYLTVRGQSIRWFATRKGANEGGRRYIKECLSRFSLLQWSSFTLPLALVDILPETECNCDKPQTSTVSIGAENINSGIRKVEAVSKRAFLCPKSKRSAASGSVDRRSRTVVKIEEARIKKCGLARSGHNTITALSC